MDRGAGLKVEGPLGQDPGRRLGAESSPCPTSSRKQGPAQPPRNRILPQPECPRGPALVSAGEP